MRINDLIVESHDLEEGPMWDKTKALAGKVGQGVANVAGGAAQGVGQLAGGVAGMGNRFTKGFRQGKAAVKGGSTAMPWDTDPAFNGQMSKGGSQGQQGAAPVGAVQQGGQDPEQLRAQGQALIKQADQIEKQQATAQKQQQSQQNQQQDAQQNQAPAQGQQQADPNAAPADQQTAPAAEPSAQTAAPAQGEQPAPAGGQQQQAPAGKLTPQQIAAKKAELQGKRAAGKSTATQTGGGFNQYVQGGGGQTMVGADKQGNPIFKQNVKREGFESRFLGMVI